MPFGSGQPSVQSRATEPVVGQRLHLRFDLAGLAVRGLCHRRVCPAHCGLAGEQLDAHGLCARCTGASPICPPARARWKPDMSQRPRVAIRQHSVLRTTSGSGHRTFRGQQGDSYDNALAETINGLYKAELIHRRAPWKTKEAVEFATLEWVSWFNHHRLLEPIGYIPPAEAEANYYRQLASQNTAMVA